MTDPVIDSIRRDLELINLLDLDASKIIKGILNDSIQRIHDSIDALENEMEA